MRFAGNNERLMLRYTRQTAHFFVILLGIVLALWLILLQQIKGDHQIQKFIVIRQIRIQKRADAFQPVQEGAAMDVKLSGGLNSIQMVFHIHFQGSHIFRALFFVMCLQQKQLFMAEHTAGDLSDCL